jgi:X-X-X-Leu-X-X-Gly heptad repeat protein
LVTWYPLTDPQALLRDLDPGGEFYDHLAPPDGKWFQEVQRLRAKLDREKAEKINPPPPEEMARRKAGLDALAAAINKCFNGGGETLTGELASKLASKLAELADGVRALASINDPDAQRTNIAEIAASLDALHKEAADLHNSEQQGMAESAARMKAKREREKARATKGVEAMMAAKKAKAAKAKAASIGADGSGAPQ